MKQFHFPNIFMGNSKKQQQQQKQTKKLGNKLTVFEIAKRNNEMMSSVLSNILGWSGGKFIQTGTFDLHARFETRFCQTGSTNTSSWFVDTFDQSQTSIQHNYPCDFMNIKENILFLRNEWTTTGEVDKTDGTDQGKCIHLYDETQGNTSASDRKLSSSGAGKQTIIKRRKQKRRQTKRSWCKIFFVKNVYVDLKRRHQHYEGFLSGQIVANNELQNKQNLRTVCRSLLFVQPTLWFCCQANSKAPKVGQVFRYVTCNNHSFVDLFVDWLNCEADVTVWKKSFVWVDA